MNARRWVHLFAMVLPVGILTAFNVAGIEPSTALTAALGSLTAAAAALAQPRTVKARSSPRPAKTGRRKGGTDATRDRTKDPRTELDAPARAASSGDPDRPT